jgi:vacuolar-type H+-ATPase subunit H
MMSQETITRILSIEHAASKLRDDAERQAARTVAQAEEAASALHQQKVEEARQEAKRIVSAGHEAAEAERATIIAQAEAEAERMEAQAERHLDQAVSYVLDQVAGVEQH